MGRTVREKQSLPSPFTLLHTYLPERTVQEAMRAKGPIIPQEQLTLRCASGGQNHADTHGILAGSFGVGKQYGSPFTDRKTECSHALNSGHLPSIRGFSILRLHVEHFA
jgi:hypothetical protein